MQKRAAAEKALADARGKQARKESAAAGYRAKAMKPSSQALVQSYLRQADAAERDALALGVKIAAYSKEVAECSKQEASLNKDLSAALQRQAAEQERTRKRREADEAAGRRRLADAERRARQRERDAERARTDALLAQAERRLEERMAEVRPPKVERLRILYVTAASKGDLRIDKEIRRVEKGVQAATHRELVEIKHLSASTPSDFLDWLPRVRPHVVHFSGHAGPDVIAFDSDAEGDNAGHVVASEAFRDAIAAVDEPPLLVVLNACESEAQLAGLLDVVPMAIGMGGSIGDQDAAVFAARFYTAIADGQSVSSAYAAARVQMEFDGLVDADLPILRVRPDSGAATTPLVIPPD